MRRAAIPALLLLMAGWAITLWVAPWSDERVNDLFVYRTFAEPVLSGALPYRDVAFEYPPLAAPAIALPGLVGTGEETFRWAFALWTLAGAAAVVLLCGALARAAGADPRRAMLAAALMPLFCGALLRTHFDLFPVALVLGALLLLVRGRPRAGLALLGVGAMTKAFPLVVVPVALVWLLLRGERRAGWQGALACAAVMVAIAGATVAVSPSGAAEAVRYHLDRPVQVESSPALVLLGLDAVGLGDAASVSSHRSDGLLHPASNAITSLFLTALVTFVALLCVSLAEGRRPRLGGQAAKGRVVAAAGRQAAQERLGADAAGLAGGGRLGAGAGAGGLAASRPLAGAAPPWMPGSRELVLGGLAACAGFAVFGKVLSPQFVIWVLPLGALAFAWRLYALAGAVALVAVLTQIEFPAHYFDVVAREPLAVGVVAARNVMLVAVLVLAVRALAGARSRDAREVGRARGALQLSRHQQLLDPGRSAVGVGLDQ